jgi:hypothetical protein
MATHRVLIFALAAVSGMTACAGTRLTVQVDPARAGFRALLMPLDERCALGGSEVTDQSGRLLITKEYCGKLQLVVGARGYNASRRVVDTCDTQLVRVELQPSAPVAYPADVCSVAAQRALQAWLSKDSSALRAMLINPEDLAMYQRQSYEPAPWQHTIDKTEDQGAECVVHARLFYEAGCEEPVRVDLLRAPDSSYQLRGIQRGE